VHREFIKGREIRGPSLAPRIVLSSGEFITFAWYRYLDCSVNISERRISLRRVNRDVHSRARSIYDTRLDDIDEMLYQSNVCYFFLFPFKVSIDRKSDDVARFYYTN